MAFGEQLQNIRHQNGLTQEQFAEQLQVSRQAVSKWESGRGYPEIEKLLEICKRYGVTLNDLFEMENPAPPKSADSCCTVPKSKWLAGGVLMGVAAVAGLIGLCLKGGTWDMTTIIWIAAMILFGILEGVTAGLTSIWFVLGSVAGLVSAVCKAPIWLQVTLFFAVSIVALVATRPLVKKMMDKSIVPTNADTVLGKNARVTESIDNVIPTGAVYVDGKTWSARSESGEPLPEGMMVRIIRMEGVKLIVEKL